MTTTRNHWDEAYRKKAETDLSWYRPLFEKSLSLIRSAAPDHSSAIIDVGGGASTLVDSLLSEGYSDLTVLDVSEVALQRPKRRLGREAARVDWIVTDVTVWRPPRTYDLWHDRAVFHFLTDGESQDAYLDALHSALRPGGTAVISTFALDGPERCSGLPVQRYSPDTLAERMGADYALVAREAEAHETPGGVTQSFMYAVLRRR